MITGDLSHDTDERGGELLPRASQPEVVSTFEAVLSQEREALEVVAYRLRDQRRAIAEACGILLAAEDPLGNRRVIVSGLGKAGIIARKVAATLSSTTTAAAFIHPVEGLHGDLGFVRPADCGLLFSYSGETIELIRLGRELGRTGCAIIAVTRSRGSTLGRMATACIEMGEVREACPLGLAPSSSTTVMLAIGDALALAVAKARGLRDEDFGRNHPAGSLGQRFLRVRDVMRTGSRFVRVEANDRLRGVVELISRARTGAAVIVAADGTLRGIFTDGDLRRAILRGGDVLDRQIEGFASIPCQMVRADDSVADALKLFHNMRIEDLPVIDRQTGRVLGLLCLKDIPTF